MSSTDSPSRGPSWPRLLMHTVSFAISFFLPSSSTPPAAQAPSAQVPSVHGSSSIFYGGQISAFNKTYVVAIEEFTEDYFKNVVVSLSDQELLSAGTMNFISVQTLPSAPDGQWRSVSFHFASKTGLGSLATSIRRHTGEWKSITDFGGKFEAKILSDHDIELALYLANIAVAELQDDAHRLDRQSMYFGYDYAATVKPDLER